MKIAMLGQKGIPATYGGIERHVEELSVRLAAMGHEVTVFCRPHYTEIDGPYKSVELRKIKSLNTKHLDAISHTLFSTLGALGGGFDIFHYHALGPSTLSFLPRLAGRKVVATVHGLDWQREKWGAAATAFLKLGEWSSAHFPQRTVVVSKTLKKYYDSKYKMDSVYIPNGVQPPTLRPAAKIRGLFGLEPDTYALFVGRLVPEKGCHHLIEAFKGIETDKKLVIAGGASHSGGYPDSLKEMAASDPRIVFTGYIYGDVLEEVYGNSMLYVQPSLIEGLPIALLEALSYGKAALVSDIPENLEVVEGVEGIAVAEYSFRRGDAGDLRARLAALLDGGPERLEPAGAILREHVLKDYDWDDVARKTEAVYKEVAA